jgi:SH3-like domain-containing protein
MATFLPILARAAEGDAPPVSGAPVPEAPPYLAIALGDDVNVRAGPGKNYEVVTKLASGEKVGVFGEAFGWARIRPAREVRTYVQKDLVATKGPGAGVILKDRVNVRSRPAPEATVVGQCARGDVVRILDAEGDWVALAAPPGVALYVRRDLVRPIGRLSGEALAAPATAVAAAPPTTPMEKLRRARELYLAEIEKEDLDLMDFGPALALFCEAEREAQDPETRAAGRDGIERVRVAARIQEDYRKRVKPIKKVLGE